MASVRLHHVSKLFGRTRALDDVSLEVEDGSFCAFVGPSGCGKSTLLRLIAGLEEASGGDIWIGARRVNEVPPARRGIAMVFQSYALYPHMTVKDNMAFGLKRARLGRAEIGRRIAQAAEKLQITPLLDRKPRELSGGQRQRVAIGRAIVREPEVFLFDEPLSNLDASLRVQMRLELARLHRDLGTTMIHVTHDQIEAMTLADRIVVLNAGRVEQIAAPLALYHAPRNLFVAGFIGSPRMNFLPACITAREGATVTLALPGDAALRLPVAENGLRPGDAVTLGIRPEHLHLGTQGDAVISGRITLIEPLGSETHLHVALPGDLTVTLRLICERSFAPGAAVTLAVPAARCHLFGNDGAAVPLRAPSDDRARAGRDIGA